jgi:hypothetical protein
LKNGIPNLAGVLCHRMTESLIGCVREMGAFRVNESDPKEESLNHIDLGGILPDMVRNRCGSQSGEPQSGSA